MPASPNLYVVRPSERPAERSDSVGLLRGCLFFTSAPIFTGIAGIWVGYNHGILNGILTGAAVALVVTILSVVIANIRGRLTTFDCIIPTILSIIAGIAFAPIKLVIDLSALSLATSIMSGVLLSAGLLMYKNQRIDKVWLIFPFITFVY